LLVMRCSVARVWALPPCRLLQLLTLMLQMFVIPGHPTKFGMIFFVCISCVSLLFHNLVTALMGKVHENDDGDNLQHHAESMLQNLADAIRTRRLGGPSHYWREFKKIFADIREVFGMITKKAWETLLAARAPADIALDSAQSKPSSNILCVFGDLKDMPSALRRAEMIHDDHFLLMTYLDSVPSG
jgi:hypothetical protein